MKRTRGPDACQQYALWRPGPTSEDMQENKTLLTAETYMQKIRGNCVLVHRYVVNKQAERSQHADRTLLKLFSCPADPESPIKMIDNDHADELVCLLESLTQTRKKDAPASDPTNSSPMSLTIQYPTLAQAQHPNRDFKETSSFPDESRTQTSSIFGFSSRSKTQPYKTLCLSTRCKSRYWYAISRSVPSYK